MKQNLLKTIGNGISKSGKNIIELGKKHSGAILLTINLVSTGVLIYEVWTRKEKIQKAVEETKDAPLNEKVKKVGKEVAPVAAAAAVATGSAVAGTIIAANKLKAMAEKVTELTDVANNAIDAKEKYQNATKEAVGEEKEKEIREAAAEKRREESGCAFKEEDVAKIQNGTLGYDVYYDANNPGFVFPFNRDREMLLQNKINGVLKVVYDEDARDYCLFDDRVTMTDVYTMIEDITGVSIKAPTYTMNLGWEVGKVGPEGVQVSCMYDGQRNGRGIYTLEFSPDPRYFK